MAINNQLFDGVIIFCAVVEQGSFSAAAIASEHSTSFISKTINKLEARLNTRLLNRTTRSISLTTDGELFYQHCQQLIKDAEHAQAFSQHIEPSGTLRISAPLNYSVNTLKTLFNQYLVRYPKVTLDLELSDRKVDIVSEGYDLAIRITREMENSSLIMRKIASSRIVTVASSQYLANHPPINHPEQLKQHVGIRYSYAAKKDLWAYSNSTENFNIDVPSNFTTNNGEIQLSYVLDHLGISRVPEFIVQEHLADGSLQTILDEYECDYVNIYLVYASRKHQSTKLRTFIDFLVEEVKKLEDPD
jgi:DNA-binding transcriptional LysR family regulator